MNNDRTFCFWGNCPRKECYRHLNNVIGHAPFINQADFHNGDCPKKFQEEDK